jgi:hypothetical protein
LTFLLFFTFLLLISSKKVSQPYGLGLNWGGGRTATPSSQQKKIGFSYAFFLGFSWWFFLGFP